MPRKKWVAQTNITPNLIRLREKRKWQIALRRYVLERNPCPQYAPYFGLDIQNMRNWFELQFEGGLTWDNFAEKWQFDHIIPVVCFNLDEETELKACWNFLNLRVSSIHPATEKASFVNLLSAKKYITALGQAVNYAPCLLLMQKITSLEEAEKEDLQNQTHFLVNQQGYLSAITHYSSFEFELLNSGRTAEEVKKDVDFLKKF